VISCVQHKWNTKLNTSGSSIQLDRACFVRLREDNYDFDWPIRKAHTNEFCEAIALRARIYRFCASPSRVKDNKSADRALTGMDYKISDIPFTVNTIFLGEKDDDSTPNPSHGRAVGSAHAMKTA
jgi:hypothetical protein